MACRERDIVAHATVFVDVNGARWCYVTAVHRPSMNIVADFRMGSPTGWGATEWRRRVAAELLTRGISDVEVDVHFDTGTPIQVPP